jgi:RNA polymerase sigma factor (sigma-70 family)
MNEEIIKKLELVIQDNKLNDEEIMNLLNDERIDSYLSELFCTYNHVFENDLKRAITNDNLYLLILAYLDKRNIPLVKENFISMSDLSEELIEYKNTVSYLKHYTLDEIEEIIDYEDKTLIINSLLEYVFMLVLEFAHDQSIFEELLEDANEELIRSVYNYDREIHDNFGYYLTSNIYRVVNNKESSYLTNTTYIQDVEVSSNYIDPVINKTDDLRLLNEVLDKASLSPLEKRVLDFRYGIIDGISWSFLDIGKELRMNKVTVMKYEAYALRKLKKVKKEME